MFLSTLTTILTQFLQIRKVISLTYQMEGGIFQEPSEAHGTLNSVFLAVCGAVCKVSLW